MFILREAAPLLGGCKSASILVLSWSVEAGLDGRISVSAVCFILKKLFIAGLLVRRTGESWCFSALLLDSIKKLYSFRVLSMPLLGLNFCKPSFVFLADDVLCFSLKLNSTSWSSPFAIDFSVSSFWFLRITGWSNEEPEF